MNQVYDELQRRLARLESGEPLESVLSGLPEAEANLIKFAVSLRQLASLSPAASRMAAQRKQFLHTAQERKIMTTQPKTSRPWAWAIGLVGALSVCALAIAGLGGLAGFGLLRNSQQSAFQAPNATSGVLGDAHGLVEIKSPDGEWTLAHNGQTIVTGQHLRTSVLSGVTLGFYDGSQIHLGPQTEISVDTLDARRGFGPRSILLTQFSGQTQNDVEHSNSAASRYEVTTPSGTGAAKGTSFQVSVFTTFIRFDVDNGTVEVTNLGVTVIVLEGQSTIIQIGQPPEEPVFTISGEGEVLATGTTWQIAGRSFLTNSSTLISGDPQVGDWVSFEGRVQTNGSYILDQITLVRHAIDNKFSFVGTVEATGDSAWTISGRAVRVDQLTSIQTGIEVGDSVIVEGGLAADGTFWASQISLAGDDASGLAFSFTGLVESMGDAAWSVSGISVTVGAETEIAEGIEIGDIVNVTGQVSESGEWQATSITPAEEAGGEFEFSGKVEDMDPWQVAGISFTTTDETAIEEGIEVGDLVQVEGQILSDGTWQATSIKRIDEPLSFEFVGEVEGIDPWVVAGVELAVDDKTEIQEDIAVGDTVKVEGRILEDGTWLAEEITLAEDNLGCVNAPAIVVSVEDGQITLQDGQVISLSEAGDVEGEVKVASVIIIQTCVQADGSIVIVSIIVIQQLDELPTALPTSEGGTGEKVTICHIPGGDEDKANTLVVDESAVPAHLGHGDTLGACS
jgi:hypothetical protein